MRCKLAAKYSLVLCLSMTGEMDAFLARSRHLHHLDLYFLFLERYMVVHVQCTNTSLFIAVR